MQNHYAQKSTKSHQSMKIGCYRPFNIALVSFECPEKTGDKHMDSQWCWIDEEIQRIDAGLKLHNTGLSGRLPV